jgi:hypothetical protein
MIIDDLDVFRRSFPPEETDSPLVVDPNAILPVPVAAQSLEPVSWNRTQIRQDLSVV